MIRFIYGHHRQRLLTLAVSFVLLLGIIARSVVQAQNLQAAKYQYQQRQNPNRWEGVKPQEVAGEKVELLAVLLDAPALSMKGRGNAYQFGFVLPASHRNVHLKVRTYHTLRGGYHYWMEPINTTYPAGLHALTWDITLARELGLDIQDFGAQVYLGEGGHLVWMPLLLHISALPPQIKAQGCRFVLLPNATMTVGYRIVSKENPSQVWMAQSNERWDKDMKSTIYWDGQDAQKRPAPQGSYLLQLNGQLTAAGSFGKDLADTYEFYYQREISH